MSCCSDICHASHIIRCKNSRPDFEICQDCIVSTRATAKKTSTLTHPLEGPKASRTCDGKMCDGRAAKVGPNRSEKGQMPILLSRRVMKRELVKIPKQTRRGKFIKLRCIITFECGHKREYVASEAPSKYGRCVECGNG